MTEWQPIETAPKDGTEIITLWQAPTGNYYKIQYWNQYGVDLETCAHKSGFCDECSDFVDDDCQWWMPLPPPPKDGEG